MVMILRGCRAFVFVLFLLPTLGYADTEEKKHNAFFVSLNYSFALGRSDAKTLSVGVMYTRETSTSDILVTPDDEGMAISMGVGIGIEAGLVLGRKAPGRFVKIPLRTYIVGDMMPVGLGTALGAFFSGKQSFLFMEFEYAVDFLFYGKVGIGYRWAWGRSRDAEGVMLPARYMDSAYCSFSLGYPLFKLNQTTTISTN